MQTAISTSDYDRVAALICDAILAAQNQGHPVERAAESAAKAYAAGLAAFNASVTPLPGASSPGPQAAR